MCKNFNYFVTFAMLSVELVLDRFCSSLPVLVMVTLDDFCSLLFRVGVFLCVLTNKITITVYNAKFGRMHTCRTLFKFFEGSWIDLPL